MKESNLEVKVGFFVLAGLAAMAMLIVAFGKFGN
jgi:Mn2+/Fe2+ NRAMP family transporter